MLGYAQDGWALLGRESTGKEKPTTQARAVGEPIDFNGEGRLESTISLAAVP
jgi:hypothetical protein